MLKVLSSILCDLDPKVKAIGQKAGICDGVPSTSALVIIIIQLLCWCAAVPAHEAYIAHTAHPVLCTHFGFKKGIRAVSCPFPMPICVK